MPDYEAATDALTDAHIRALRSDATEAGDDETVVLCEDTLRLSPGFDGRGRAAIARIIVDDHANDDEPMHPVVIAART